MKLKELMSNKVVVGSFVIGILIGFCGATALGIILLAMGS